MYKLPCQLSHDVSTVSIQTSTQLREQLFVQVLKSGYNAHDLTIRGHTPLSQLIWGSNWESHSWIGCNCRRELSVNSVETYLLSRAVASLTVPGGQEFQFPHFLPKF